MNRLIRRDPETDQWVMTDGHTAVMLDSTGTLDVEGAVRRAEIAVAGEWVITPFDTAELASTLVTESSLKEAAWVVVDERGDVHFGPVTNRWQAEDAKDEILAQPTTSGTITGDEYTLYVNRYETGTDDSMNLLSSRKEADGFWEMADAATSWVNDRLPEEIRDKPGNNKSYDWCRFRENQRCLFPTNGEPMDNGYCWRQDWEDQVACTISEPGPESKDPLARPSVTLVAIRKKADRDDRWYEFYSQATSSGLDSDDADRFAYWAIDSGEEDAESALYRWENEGYSLVAKKVVKEAAWTDIQAKAKRIKDEGKVKIVAVKEPWITGEVQGDSKTYQTTIMRSVGSKSVAQWECGCAWSDYSWGRSGRWKRYEGRMCSHALALTYEAQSREFGGGTITEDREYSGGGSYYFDPFKQDDLVRAAGLRPRGRAFTAKWRDDEAISKSAALRVMAYGEPDDYEAMADQLVEEARREEPRVSADFSWVVKRFGGEMEGWDFRIKEKGSLAQKLERKSREKGISGDALYSSINDMLRYTMSFPEPDWGNSVQKAMWALEEKGYRIVEGEIENYWVPHDAYSGLHSLVQTPSGFTVELQFHTSASFQLKQEKLHVLYEEFRAPATPLARKQELYDQMVPMWEEIGIPTNALDFPNHKSHPRPASLQRRAAIPGDYRDASDWDNWFTSKPSYEEFLEKANESTPIGDQIRQVMQDTHIAPPVTDEDGMFGSGQPWPASTRSTTFSDPQDYYDWRDEYLNETSRDMYLPGWQSPSATGMPPSLAYSGWDQEGDIEDWKRERDAEKERKRQEKEEGAEATFHDEPEPALPSTDGESVFTDESTTAGEQYAPEDDSLELEAYGAQNPNPSDSDIASHAKAVLAKMSAKTFTPAEQAAIINEQGKAGNLDLLQIEGTHYELLGEDDEELDYLFL